MLEDVNLPYELPTHWGRILNVLTYSDFEKDWDRTDQRATAYVIDLLSGLACKQRICSSPGKDEDCLYWDGWQNLIISGHLPHAYLWTDLVYKCGGYPTRPGAKVLWVNSGSQDTFRQAPSLLIGTLLNEVFTTISAGADIVVFETAGEPIVSFILLGLTILGMDCPVSLCEAKQAWAKCDVANSSILDSLTPEQTAYLEGLGDGRQGMFLPPKKQENWSKPKIRGGEYDYDRTPEGMDAGMDSRRMVGSGPDLVFLEEEVLRSRSGLLSAIRNHSVDGDALGNAIDGLICATLKASLLHSHQLMEGDSPI